MNEDAKQKISGIIDSIKCDQAELTRLEKAHDLAFETEADAIRKANLIDGEIESLKNRSEHLKRNLHIVDTTDIDRATDQRDSLLRAASTARAERNRINEAIGVLQRTLKYPEHLTFTRSEVLYVHSELEEKRAALVKIDTAIAGEREKIAAATVSDAPVAELKQRLEDLLAASIDGSVPAAEIESLQAKLIAASADLQRERELATALVERARQTIAGLERKRASLEEELTDAAQVHRHAVRLFLQTEMRELRAGYLEAGRALVDTFSRMRALALLSQNVVGTGAVRDFAGDIAPLELPQPFDPNGRREPGLSVSPNAVEMALHRIRTEYEADGIDFTNPGFD